MRNIWIRKKKNGIVAILVSMFIMIVFVFGMIYLVNTRNGDNEEIQIELLKENLNKTITLCYSIEGQYPPSVEYMVENYGLKYDSEKYYIHYEIIGSNLMPNYDIFYYNS